jgi:hypothetical protein
MPALSKKLDLVLRDKSLEDSLSEVAKAAKISIKVLPGSVADAAALSGAEELRVTYLDLRHATVAEALDWLLQPERLTWWAADGSVVAGSERRRDGTSPWIYDVSLVALPDGAELEKLGDGQKAAAAAQQEAAEFLSVVRAQLGAKDTDQSVLWFAPGQLLVFGTPDQHSKTEKLLTSLADSKATLAGAAAKLHTVTAKRFADRKARAERSAKADALMRAASAHQQFGWQLLAAAAAGKLDDEALTELTIAWKRPETAELLKGGGRAVVLRSWWMVKETLSALGANDNKELSALESLARKTCEPAASDALAALEKKPDDSDAFAAVLYAALATRDADYTAKALPLLTKSSGKDDALSAARTIAKALLADRKQIDRAALANVVTGGVAGDDLTVLLAMAAARAGGEPSSAFRAAARELVGGQPLDGNLVVLISRLAARQLPLVAER